jgi:EpsI family protein
MKTRILLLSITFLAASALIVQSSRSEITPIRESLSGFPVRLGSWEGKETRKIDDRVMAVLGVDDYIDRVYYSPQLFPARLYIGYYQSQRSGDTIHSPLNCLPGAGWNPAKRGHISIAIAENSLIEINRIVIVKGMDKQVVLYWYQSHGRVVASEYWGKIYTVLDALRSNRTDAALVRVICPVPGTSSEAEESAEEYAVDFVKALFPSLNRFLPL